MDNKLSFYTKYGWINVIEKNNKIVSIGFGKIKNNNSSILLKQLKKLIKGYFSGKIIVLKVSLEIVGTKLQKKIWKEISKIPYGKTTSYGKIAKKLNTSPRYVGNICGQNKHLLFIPCHRVIRSDGNIGGFSGLGGVKLKKKLLDLESQKKK